MKNLLLIILLSLFILSSSSITAQGVAINENGDPPNANAMLDISSTSKGMLIPRMSFTDRTGMTLTVAEEGLMVYQSGVTDPGFYSWDGTAWQYMSAAGGSGGADGDWTVGTGVVYNTTHKIGIGLTNPTEELEITGQLKLSSDNSTSAPAGGTGTIRWNESTNCLLCFMPAFNLHFFTLK
jgi:hypothetical protein